MAFFSGLSTCFPFGEAGAFGVFRGARLRMRGREYPQSFAWRMTAPSAEGAKGDFASAEARRWTEPVWQLSDRPRHPFGSLTLILGRNPTLAGRGGSVSRRDHNQAYRRATALSGGTNYAEATNSNASRFPGGSAREGPFSERPPPSHTLVFVLLFGRGPGGGASL